MNLDWIGGAGPFQVQMNTNVTGTNWVSVLTTTNHSATVTNTGTSGFFRVLNQSGD